jgi:hypothetical protein
VPRLFVLSLLFAPLMCFIVLNAAADERKKQEDKEYHKTYQERLYQENLDNIERKQQMKLQSFAEEK